MRLLIVLIIILYHTSTPYNLSNFPAAPSSIIQEVQKTILKIMNKLFLCLTFLFLLPSCNSNEKYTKSITNDFPLIKESIEEIIQNYDTCLSLFGKSRKLYDGSNYIIFEISKENNDDIKKLRLIKTAMLLNSEYIIKIDPSYHFNFFFEKKSISRSFGVTRYSAWYKNLIGTKINTMYLLTPNYFEVLKTLDEKTSIVRIDEHFE